MIIGISAKDISVKTKSLLYYVKIPILMLLTFSCLFAIYLSVTSLTWQNLKEYYFWVLVISISLHLPVLASLHINEAKSHKDKNNRYVFINIGLAYCFKLNRVKFILLFSLLYSIIITGILSLPITIIYFVFHNDRFLIYYSLFFLFSAILSITQAIIIGNIRWQKFKFDYFIESLHKRRQADEVL